MELSDDFGQFKSDFARQIAMEEKAINLNIWVLKGEHSLRRGTSESVLGSKGKKNTPRQVSAFNNSKLHGSVGSLPSLITADDLVEEKWVTSDQFKDILVQKEKEISDIKYPEEVLPMEIATDDVKRLEEENAELRRRLEMDGSRNSHVSLMEISKYQELQRDVAKLQYKICKMEQSSADPTATRRLVSFLETFKSQLPVMNSPRDDVYKSVLDRISPELNSPSIDSYSPSFQSYRPSIDSYGIDSYGRPSMGSYRAACHPTPYREEGFRHQPGRGGSCVAQLSRMNAGTALLGSEVLSSFKYCQVEVSDDDYEASLLSGATRPSLPRSRVVMGAKTAHRARCVVGGMGVSYRAYSSSDFLREPKMREEVFLSSAEEVFVERTPQSINRSMQSRSKSCNNVLDYKDAPDSGRGTDYASQSSFSSLEMVKGSKEEEIKKDKGKDESKVHKFFKRLRKLVTKETKVNEGKGQEEVMGMRKMTRSMSHRIGKSKNLPKRLKSFHCSSSPRLKRDFDLN